MREDMIQINNIRVSFTADENGIKKKIANICRIPEEKIHSVRMLRRALDARKKQDICYLINAAVELDAASERKALHLNDDRIVPYEEVPELDPRQGTKQTEGRIIVVGMGPAGLFAAYLLARNGYRPLVIERGRTISERVKDVNRLWTQAELDPDSNVMFGEGGAGTFSDGKLTSRSKDPRGTTVLNLFRDHGAPEEITYLAKPHIGTDRLRKVIQSIRESILECGGEIRFSTKLTGIGLQDGQIRSAEIESNGNKETIPCCSMVLAIGQGARDTYRMLFDSGIAMQPKPFAVGCRIEHPQSLINRSQFGDFAEDPRLGAAEYRLTAKSGDRGVYTFCMCPGGFVVASSSDKDQVVVNGMSNYARDAENANAAVVVQVSPEDFGTEALDGVRFCEDMERKAYVDGGSNFCAPASRVTDFLNRTKTVNFSGVNPTYRPGVTGVNLWETLPEFVAQGISDGIRSFAGQLKGFDLPDAVLTAVETRTSSPVRIPRDETGESVSAKGIYPVGEGAGYAGGIVSAAIDGLKAAEKIISIYAPSN